MKGSFGEFTNQLILTIMSKTIKINYHQYDIWEDILTSSLALDFVGFEPETLFQNADKKSVYYQCPARAIKRKELILLDVLLT